MPILPRASAERGERRTLLRASAMAAEITGSNPLVFTTGGGGAVLLQICNPPNTPITRTAAAIHQGQCSRREGGRDLRFMAEQHRTQMHLTERSAAKTWRPTDV